MLYRSVPQQSWASGASGAKEVTIPDVRGRIEQIEVKVSNNTGNVTATVAIASANAGSLYSQAAIPENAATVYRATSDATDFDAFYAAGDLTVTITPSGDPGASGLTVDVNLYGEGEI